VPNSLPARDAPARTDRAPPRAARGQARLGLGTGAGAELRQPLCVAVVGGLLVSQLLTLYITPVVYLYLDKADQLLKRRLNPVAEEHDTHEPPAPHVIEAEWGSRSRRTQSG
jgi:hypothetical protein